MFGQSNWKQETHLKIDQLEQQVADLQRSLLEVRAQYTKLAQNHKTVTKKLVWRLPLSVESLEKNLHYDLIFSEELEGWQRMANEGLIIDLRSPEEFQKAHIEGAVNLPAEFMGSKIDKLSRVQPLLFVCENGVKSVSTSELLYSKGFSFLYVLKGGMHHYPGSTVAALAPPPNPPAAQPTA